MSEGSLELLTAKDSVPELEVSLATLPSVMTR